MGCSIKRFMREKPSSLFLKKMNDVYQRQKYVLLPNIDRRLMYIMIKEGANTDDILMSYFHAVLLSIIICAINNENMVISTDIFNFISHLQQLMVALVLAYLLFCQITYLLSKYVWQIADETIGCVSSDPRVVPPSK